MSKKLFSNLLILSLIAQASIGLFAFPNHAGAAGTTYYLDNCDVVGNDTNNGTSASTPWLTINKVNTSSFVAGDTISFRKGCTWREQLTVPSSGDATGNIIFGAYGATGANPIIDGADILNSGGWTLEPQVTTIAEDLIDNTGTKPISWWMMEDVDNPRLDGNTTNANDLTRSGSPVRDSEYKQGTYSVSTPTSNDRDGRSYVNLSANFPFKAATTGFTAGFWAKLANPMPAFGLMLGFSDNSAKGFYFSADGAGKIRFRLYKSPSGNVNIDSNTTYTDAGWHHIVARWNPVATANEVSLWIDGVKQTTTGTATAVNLDTADDFIFRGGSALKFDEMFVSDVGLTDAQIQGIYNYGLVGYSTSINTYYSGALSATPNQVFANGVRMTPVAAKSSLVVNSWYWDAGNSRIYVRTSGDDAPSGYTIEASQRDYGVRENGKNYITLQNLSLQKVNQNGLYFSNTASNIIVDGINSSYSFQNGIRSITSQAITNATVQNSTFSWNGASGIFIGKSSHDWTIQNNNIYNNSQIQDGVGDHGSTGGIYTWNDDSSVLNLVIQNNNVYNNGILPDGSKIPNISYVGGVGIWFDTTRAADYVHSSIARYNLVHDNQYVGIYLEHAGYQQIYNNVIYNTTGYGIRIGDWSHLSGGVYNNVVYNNTIYNSSLANIQVVGASTGSAGSCVNNIIKNNIAVGGSGLMLDALYGGENDGTNGSGNIYEYNSFGNEAVNFIRWGNGINKSTYSAWETAYGGTTNSIQTDPLFTSTVTPDFSLQSTSPAINAGVSLGDTYKNALAVTSSWPSSVTTVDQTLRGSGWEIGAYIYPVPQAPTIGTPEVQSTSAIRWNFTDTASDETGFRVYDNTNTLATSSATTNLTYLDETGLTANTQYTGRYAVAYNTYGNSASSTVAVSKYTLAPTPTNLSGTAGLTTMALSVDAFANPTAGSSGYYFSRSGANSGWITTNSWSDSGLACGTSYTYSVIYKNGDGTETDPISLTKSTNSCPGGGGMPAGWNNSPKAPVGGFGVSVNNGAESTSIPTVILNLKGGSDTAKMVVSNFSDFRDTGQENYNSSKVWNLCWKSSLLQTPLTCPTGTYTVYAKFYAPWGTNSGTVSDTIVYKTSNQANQNLVGILPTQSFTKDLKFGQSSADIKRLQIFLNSDPTTQIAKSGVGSPGKETNIFGFLTKQAVIKFQQKYASEILTPLGLKKGTGIVSKNTRAKINKLLGF